MKHGDGVKDVAFEVEDCIGLYKVQYMLMVMFFKLNSVSSLIPNDCC